MTCVVALTACRQPWLVCGSMRRAQQMTTATTATTTRTSSDERDAQGRAHRRHRWLPHASGMRTRLDDSGDGSFGRLLPREPGGDRGDVGLRQPRRDPLHAVGLRGVALPTRQRVSCAAM